MCRTYSYKCGLNLAPVFRAALRFANSTFSSVVLISFCRLLAEENGGCLLEVNTFLPMSFETLSMEGDETLRRSNIKSEKGTNPPAKTSLLSTQGPKISFLLEFLRAEF